MVDGWMDGCVVRQNMSLFVNAHRASTIVHERQLKRGRKRERESGERETAAERKRQGGKVRNAGRQREGDREEILPASFVIV